MSGAHVHADVFPTLAERAGVDTSIILEGSLHPQRPVALDGYRLLPALREAPIQPF